MFMGASAPKRSVRRDVRRRREFESVYDYTHFDESESSRREATGARVALYSRAKAKYDKRTSCALSLRAKATMRTMSSESED
jgi:hypothetical protein